MNSIEIPWYLNFDGSMIAACIGGILILILYLEKNRGKNINEEKLKSGITNYFVPTWINYAYHVVSGFVMLSISLEIGVPIFDFIIQKSMTFFGFNTEFTISSAEQIVHLLAALSGIMGGYVFAKLISWGQNKFKTNE